MNWAMTTRAEAAISSKAFLLNWPRVAFVSWPTEDFTRFPYHVQVYLQRVGVHAVFHSQPDFAEIADDLTDGDVFLGIDFNPFFYGGGNQIPFLEIPQAVLPEARRLEKRRLP